MYLLLSWLLCGDALRLYLWMHHGCTLTRRLHYTISPRFYNIVVSILNMGFVCPKCDPKHVFSLHTLRGAEEYYERVQFTKCRRLQYSGERDSETVAAQFLSRACSVSTVWRTTVALGVGVPLVDIGRLRASGVK